MTDLIDKVEDEYFKKQMEFCLTDIGCVIDNLEEEFTLWVG